MAKKKSSNNNKTKVKDKVNNSSKSDNVNENINTNVTSNSIDQFNKEIKANNTTNEHSTQKLKHTANDTSRHSNESNEKLIKLIDIKLDNYDENFVSNTKLINLSIIDIYSICEQLSIELIILNNDNSINTQLNNVLIGCIINRIDKLIDCHFDSIVIEINYLISLSNYVKLNYLKECSFDNKDFLLIINSIFNMYKYAELFTIKIVEINSFLRRVVFTIILAGLVCKSTNSEFDLKSILNKFNLINNYTEDISNLLTIAELIETFDSSKLVNSLSETLQHSIFLNINNTNDTKTFKCEENLKKKSNLTKKDNINDMDYTIILDTELSDLTRINAINLFNSNVCIQDVLNKISTNKVSSSLNLTSISKLICGKDALYEAIKNYEKVLNEYFKIKKRLTTSFPYVSSELTISIKKMTTIISKFESLIKYLVRIGTEKNSNNDENYTDPLLKQSIIILGKLINDNKSSLFDDIEFVNERLKLLSFIICSIEKINRVDKEFQNTISQLADFSANEIKVHLSIYLPLKDLTVTNISSNLSVVTNKQGPKVNMLELAKGTNTGEHYKYKSEESLLKILNQLIELLKNCLLIFIGNNNHSELEDSIKLAISSVVIDFVPNTLCYHYQKSFIFLPEKIIFQLTELFKLIIHWIDNSGISNIEKDSYFKLKQEICTFNNKVDLISSYN